MGLNTVSEKAKHRDVAMLRAYVPPGEYAAARKALEMSQMLDLRLG